MKSLLLFYISVLFALCSCANFTINDESDTEVEKFLNETMENYGEWLRNKSEDPSTPIPNTLFLSQNSEYSVNLTCQIKNQRLVNHSKTINDLVESASSFTEHYLAVVREVFTPYQFQGDMVCSGVIWAIGFQDVDRDISFVAMGNWTITANDSVESIEVLNVGITDQGTFDLTHSWNVYNLYPTLSEITFDGDLRDMEGGSQIVNHKGKVLNVFRVLYRDFLRQRSYDESNDFNPSKRLFLSYLIDDIIKKVNISDIVTGTPPPTYSPTQRVTTASTTISTTTTTTPSTSSTGNGDGSSTGRNCGRSVTTNFGLVYLTLFIGLLMSVDSLHPNLDTFI